MDYGLTNFDGRKVNSILSCILHKSDSTLPKDMYFLHEALLRTSGLFSRLFQDELCKPLLSINRLPVVYHIFELIFWPVNSLKRGLLFPWVRIFVPLLMRFIRVLTRKSLKWTAELFLDTATYQSLRSSYAVVDKMVHRAHKLVTGNVPEGVHLVSHCSDWTAKRVDYLHEPMVENSSKTKGNVYDLIKTWQEILKMDTIGFEDDNRHQFHLILWKTHIELVRTQRNSWYPKTPCIVQYGVISILNLPYEMITVQICWKL